MVGGALVWLWDGGVWLGRLWGGVSWWLVWTGGIEVIISIIL
jgi:hypothetical protein